MPRSSLQTLPLGARDACLSIRMSLLGAIVAGCWFGMVPTSPAMASEVAETNVLVEEVAHIRVALERMVAIMEGQSTASQTELLMRRLEVAVARLAPDETALRRQREQVDTAIEEKAQYEQMREVWEAQLADQDPERVTEDVVRRQTASFEAQLERLEQRRWQAEQRMLTLEADLEQRRAVIHALEAEVDRRLGLE